MSIIGSELLYDILFLCVEWRQQHDRRRRQANRSERMYEYPPSYSGIGQKQGTLGYPYIHIYIHPHKKYTKEASKV